MRSRFRRNRHATAAQKAPRLKMTSMMDILTVLLLFLLKSFVVDADVTAPPPDVTLPKSTSTDLPETAIVVAISGDAISVGGRPVTTVGAAMAGGDLLIRELEAELNAELDQQDALAARKGKDAAAPGQITIQGDKDLEYQLLEKVMYTCGAAGFDRMALAVIREAGGA
ncbi:MAG TPA: biopolymer transporter ExbD [bacterium]|nr:biopolymer transporter ExbD [bacterium]